MTAEQVAASLVTGTLAVAAVPELGDGEFAEEVDARLAGVGLERVRARDVWIARRRPQLVHDDRGWTAFHGLHQPHLAVLAIVYLHTVYLPRQAGVAADELAAVPLAELSASLPSYQRQTVRSWVTELRRMGFLTGEGDDVAAGPLLAVMDAAVADERADAAVRAFLVRRQLKARATELGDAPA